MRTSTFDRAQRPTTSATRLPRRAAIACLAAGALAACGGGVAPWTKAGASEAMIANDFDECEVFAQAVSLAESTRSSDIYFEVTPAGDIVASPLPGVDSLRYMRQVEAFEHCMASRGYSRTDN